MMVSNRNLLFQGSIFRGHVSWKWPPFSKRRFSGLEKKSTCSILSANKPWKIFSGTKIRPKSNGRSIAWFNLEMVEHNNHLWFHVTSSLEFRGKTIHIQISCLQTGLNATFTLLSLRASSLVTSQTFPRCFHNSHHRCHLKKGLRFSRCFLWHSMGSEIKITVEVQYICTVDKQNPGPS